MTLPGKWSILDFKNKIQTINYKIILVLVCSNANRSSFSCMCAALKGIYLYMNPDFLRNWPKKKKNSNFLLLLFLFCFTGQNFTVQPRLAWSFRQPSVSVSEYQITDGSPQAQRHHCLFTKQEMSRNNSSGKTF